MVKKKKRSCLFFFFFFSKKRLSPSFSPGHPLCAENRWGTPAGGACWPAASSSGPADAALCRAPRSARRSSEKHKMLVCCCFFLSWGGGNTVKSFGCYSLLTVKRWQFTFTSHLGRLVQLPGPLHDPLLGLLIGVFICFIFKPLTLGCPGGVLQELRTQNQ